MNGKTFFDTNILTYAVDRKDQKKEDVARRLIRLAVVRQNGVVSYQVLQEFLNVGFKKFLPPLTPDKGHLYLAAWTADFQVVPWSLALLTQGLRLKERYRLPWYDCLILAAALEAECETLFSEDGQHGQKVEGLTIVNPFL